MHSEAPMRYAMFLDIETNGLNPDTIWVAVTMQDGVVQEHYTPETLTSCLSR